MISVLQATFIPVLAYGAWRDYHTRLVPSKLWYPHIIIGGIALITTMWMSRGTDIIMLIAPAVILTAISLMFWNAGSFGLADVKAIVAVSVLFPHDAVVIMLMSMICALAWPLYIAFDNAQHGEWRRDMASVIIVPRDQIENMHGWDADTGRDLRDIDIAQLPAMVRVTPGIPYLVPLFIGVVTTVILINSGFHF
ncbi:MAG: A24 family peptidase [Haloferacaceae archaeon]|nr:A24 family peptidase [Haloferacaceae archaeon]